MVSGSRLLQAALAGRSQTWLAGVLHVKPSTVSRWITGAARPDPASRRALATLLGISEDSWLTTAERQAIARLAADPTPAAPSGEAA